MCGEIVELCLNLVYTSFKGKYFCPSRNDSSKYVKTAVVGDLKYYLNDTVSIFIAFDVTLT